MADGSYFNNNQSLNESDGLASNLNQQAQGDSSYGAFGGEYGYEDRRSNQTDRNFTRRELGLGRRDNRDRSRDRRNRPSRDGDNRADLDRNRDREREGGSRQRNRSRDRDRRHRDDDDRTNDNQFGGRRRHNNYLQDETDGCMHGSSEGVAVGHQDAYDDYGSSSSSGKRINGRDWKDRLTSIREAHFNRSKQAPPAIAQNQFSNDGSFMEMFKKKMQENSQGADASSVTPNSLLMASKSIQFSPDLSLPPLTTTSTADVVASAKAGNNNEDVDGIPIQSQKPIPMPVSGPHTVRFSQQMGKRRMSKPLKTGIVLKKAPNSEEDDASQEKLDAWARYLQEVQRYKSSKCMDEDAGGRPLVK